MENFKRRYLHHHWCLKANKHCNSHLQKSFNKYGGSNFEFIILHILKEGEDIDALERKFISLAQKEHRSYNIQDGGQDHTNKGRSLSDEHKRKIGEANRKRMLGRTASNATKKKMSETRTGKTPRRDNLINFSTARHIKIMIMIGLKSCEICDISNVEYRVVNNIKSNNTYKEAYVDGWEEWYKKHKLKRKSDK